MVPYASPPVYFNIRSSTARRAAALRAMHRCTGGMHLTSPPCNIYYLSTPGKCRPRPIDRRRTASRSRRQRERRERAAARVIEPTPLAGRRGEKKAESREARPCLPVRPSLIRRRSAASLAFASAQRSWISPPTSLRRQRPLTQSRCCPHRRCLPLYLPPVYHPTKTHAGCGYPVL